VRQPDGELCWVSASDRLFDRHFAAIGGRVLIMYFPLAGLAGFGLGALAGLLRGRVARTAYHSLPDSDAKE
jgi:hypothetical protein